LLTPEHQLTPRVEKTLRAAIAQDVHIVLATGKSRAAAVPIIEKLGIPSHGIFLQGLALYDEAGKLAHQQTLDPDLVRRVITIAEDRGFGVIAYTANRILVRKRAPETDAVLIPFHEPAPEAIGPLQNVAGVLPINKLLFVGEPAAISSFRWQMGHLAGSAARLMQAGWPNMLELLPPGASKGAMLARLLEDLSLKPSEVMAIGDAENDFEMVQLAGVGVAMGNATQHLKDAADFVTTSNREDGVAVALEKYIPGLAPAPQPAAEAENATVMMPLVRPPAPTENPT
jgi:Cof subfamily protein (haloacid dehalogenase superfamily)